MKNSKKRGFSLLELDPNKLEISELANLNPLMSDKQFDNFIKLFENGFDYNISHIVLYKGKVVDGRHRVKACKQLGINLYGRNLPSTMSTEEVKEFIHGTENRRHQTPTQLAIRAYLFWLKQKEEGNSISQDNAANQKLSNKKMLGRAKKLDEIAGRKILSKLLDGKKILITNNNGTVRPTDVLTTLINYFKNRNEDLIQQSDKYEGHLTDEELELARLKYNELCLECNSLVRQEISKMIFNNDIKGK